MSRDPVLPAVRAAVFAAVCLALGAAAHRAMSQAPVPGWALATGGLGAYLPARYAAGRGERGLFGITCLMGGVQVAFHLLFSFAQAAPAAGRSAAMPGMAGSGASMPGMSMPAGMSMPGMTGGPMHVQVSGGMLAAHAVAAVVCSWWLYRGEVAVHAVVRRAAFRLRRFWPAAVAAVVPFASSPPRAPRVAPHSRALRGQWLRGALAQRGPPVSHAFR